MNCPDRGDTYFEKMFCNRFRLPYDSFLELFDMVNDDDFFERWNRRTNGANSRLGLLLLGVLCYLGRGWTFDNLEESTAILVHDHRNFIYIFLQYGRDVLYPKYVKYPTTSENIKMHPKEYEIVGFHGTVGSIDAYHIIMEKRSHRLKQNHLGGKSKQTC